MRTYLVIYMYECDRCHTANTFVRLKPAMGWVVGPRCPCGKVNSSGSWNILSEISAESAYAAFDKHLRAQKDTK